MNRRDFLIKSLMTAMLAKMGNPTCLVADGPSPVRTLYIFLRGGIDGHQAFHPIDSGVLDFFRGIRPSLTLQPMVNNQRTNKYHLEDVLPIGLGTNQFGFHPWWERLRSRNLRGDIPDSRIRCDTVLVGGVNRPLDDFLAFRIMKGVGLIHHVNLNSIMPAKDLPINKSHFDQQQVALTGFKSFARNDGYLGKFVYFGEENPHLFKMVGFGGFSQKELGSKQANGTERTIVTLGTTFRDISRVRDLNLSFHSYSCQSYFDARNKLLYVGDRGTSTSVLGNFEMYRDLLRAARKEGGIFDIFNRAFDNANEIENISAQISNVFNTTQVNLLYPKFAQHYYLDPSTKATRSDTHIARVMFEIAKFFLASNLPTKRVAALSLGGFDTHSSQNSVLEDLLTQLAGALHGLFYTILTEAPDLMGCLNVYIITEFGRTLAQNSAFSTDHGWGNIMLGIFGLPISLVNSASFRPRQLDREIGPRYIPSDINPDTRAIDYVKNESEVHLGVNRYHLFPKVSMLSGLARLLKSNFPEADSYFMEEEFFKKNYLALSCQNNDCLWDEFLRDIPGRA